MSLSITIKKEMLCSARGTDIKFSNFILGDHLQFLIRLGKT